MSQRTAKNLLFCKIFVGFFINNFGVPSINFQSMKKFILFLFLISTAFAGREQNLVPNGGFELYSGCPINTGQLDSALFWINPAISILGRGSSDYFNSCNNNPYSADVPDNACGYQMARSGVGYAGIILYHSIFYWREYLEVPLIAPLNSNTCYHLEMYVSNPNYSTYVTDALSVYFSDTLISGITNPFALPYTPQINNPSGFITDTLNDRCQFYSVRGRKLFNHWQFQKRGKYKHYFV
jgi:hypothetical protein